MYSPLASMARTSASWLAKAALSTGLGMASVYIVMHLVWCVQ